MFPGMHSFIEFHLMLSFSVASGSTSSVGNDSGCPKGQMKRGSSCMLCAVGFYKDVVGDRTCFPCGTGRTTNKPGATKITDCGKVHHCLLSLQIETVQFLQISIKAINAH